MTKKRLIIYLLKAEMKKHIKYHDDDGKILLFYSDPYVKVSLFRGDRDTGYIDSASTTVIKKVGDINTHV